MAVPYQYQRNNPQAYAVRINSNCNCEAIQGGYCPIGQTHLRWTWSSGGQSEYFDGCTGYCNPMNCSNTACSTKGCNAARALFCSKHGKQCGSVKKCYGPQGQDPCPAACNATTDQAISKVMDYLLDGCGIRQTCGLCLGIKAWMKGNLMNGYTSGIEAIRKLMCSGGTLNGMNLTQYVAFVAKAFRCGFINDPAFVNCRSGCPGGTCNGKKCNNGQKLNSSCNCVPLNEKDPLTDFFGSWCHTFDFLPWGGCNNQTNTLLFVGGLALLVFVLFRRI